MRRLIASVAIIGLLIGVAAPAAQAGSSHDVALGLASFAAFHAFVVAPLLFPPPAVVVRPPAVVVPREVVYRPVVAPPPPVVYAAPAPAYSTEVQYPHGRYELRARGPHYMWVSIPAVPPPPPPPFVP
jgi:hypothetical protein